MNPILMIRASKAACRNAEDYLTEARILAEHGAFGHATGLAVLGTEECGKAMACAQLAIGTMDKSDTVVMSLFKRHEPKQLFGAFPLEALTHLLEPVLERIVHVVRRWMDNAERDPALLASPETLRRFAAEVMSECGSLEDPSLADEWARFRAQLQQHVREVNDERRLQDIKHRGLYVDLHRNKDVVLEPSEVLAGEYERQRGVLGRAVEATQAFVSACGQEDALPALRSALAVMRPQA
jgi:AbiV family abortive infection protein